MDRIKNINQIMEIVRTQVSGKSSDIRNKKAQTTQGSASSKTGKISQSALKKKITDKLKAIDSEAPLSMQKSKEIFLESVILWEFGENLINDPGFPALIDKIRSTLDENEQTSRNFDRLIKQLIQ
jgi:hypothetical protein